jgi:hypothetical protein
MARQQAQQFDPGVARAAHNTDFDHAVISLRRMRFNSSGEVRGYCKTSRMTGIKKAALKRTAFLPNSRRSD